MGVGLRPGEWENGGKVKDGSRVKGGWENEGRVKGGRQG